MKEGVKHIYPLLIASVCALFGIVFLFYGDIAGGEGLFEGAGNVLESLANTEELKMNGMTFIDELGERNAPTIEYISGAQEVGGYVSFKEQFLVTTDSGTKNGSVEDDFAMYLVDIRDDAGNSVMDALTTADIENISEIPAAFIYDKDLDLLYFHNSGTFNVLIKVCGSNGAEALYEFTLPVEVS